MKDSPHERKIESDRPWKVKELSSVLTKWQNFMYEKGGWNSTWIENHDVARSVSRYCDDSDGEKRVLGSKLVGLMELSLGGTVYVFQGQVSTVCSG
jgi:oligo-1,6-glucosidase